jgi:hypothetical protein
MTLSQKSFSWIGVGEVNPKSSIAFLDRFGKIELFESAHLLKFCAKIRFYEDTGIRCWIVVFERV